MAILIGETPLTLSEIIAIVREGEIVSLAPSMRQALQETRDYIDAEWMHDDAPLIYSFNTGVGVFKDRRIALEDIGDFQINLILAHATGLGDPMPEEVSRAVMLLRLNAFSLNASGVTLEIAERIVDFLNHGITPVIPEQGSVGASGDLAPLAHMSAALCGFEEGQVFYQGRRIPAREAASAAGLAPEVEMLSKDASALINGSTVSLAYAVIACWDAQNIIRHADIALALSLEAMRCEKDAFHPALHQLRPHPGQQAVARNIMRLIGDSERMSEQARAVVFPEENRMPGETPPPRVQDVYSLRCAPQVHGPVREALNYAQGILEREVNAATDNPLIVEDVEGKRALSGGHFHGQYIAQASDLIAMVMTDLGSISERRIARLIDPVMSFGLPRNLTAGKAGLNTGFATVQCSMSALVMENRGLSMPASVDSVPAKGNAEDHVSNSIWAARKSRIIVGNVEQIIGAEIAMASQGMGLIEHLTGAFPMGTMTSEIRELLRQTIPVCDTGDIWYAKWMEAAKAMIRKKDLLMLAERLDPSFE